MCDELTALDNERFLNQTGISRREFNKLGAAAAVAMMLPPVANAQDVVENEVLINTPDGEADAYFVHPSSGAHAAVMIWPDILGIRSSFRGMGKRLAQSGYSVLVINPYYRTQQGSVVPEGTTFNAEVRSAISQHTGALSLETILTDGRAFVEYLDQQPSVDSSRKIGTTGYCMTGSYALRLAAAMPDRIGAGASFHGGGLATDAETSPHLLAPQIEAGLLIAIAENDDERDPDAKVKLREAFDAAGVDAEVEVYEGTLHGWCPPDSAVYNEAQAEKAWSRMLALFDKHLA
jgi:carboxymethylenebutenolidase